MGRITSLEQQEPVDLDTERLEQLYLELGSNAADNVVCRALEELAARLSRVGRCHGEGRLDDMVRNARGVAAMAGQLGMHRVAAVANDVIRCTGAGDPVALAATLARLVRLGERCLTEIWDLQDLTI